MTDKRALAIAVSMVLGISLTAAPALAGEPSPVAGDPGPGRNCPGIVWGDGVYYDSVFDPTDPLLAGGATRVSFYFWVGDLATDLPTASCRPARYTVAFLPTDATGVVVSNAPVHTQTWRGDGTTYEFVTAQYFAVDPPAGLCVYATSQIGPNVIHYAPSGADAGTCLWLQLDPESNPGRSFRG